MRFLVSEVPLYISGLQKFLLVILPPPLHCQPGCFTSSQLADAQHFFAKEHPIDCAPGFNPQSAHTSLPIFHQRSLGRPLFDSGIAQSRTRAAVGVWALRSTCANHLLSTCANHLLCIYFVQIIPFHPEVPLAPSYPHHTAGTSGLQAPIT